MCSCFKMNPQRAIVITARENLGTRSKWKSSVSKESQLTNEMRYVTIRPRSQQRLRLTASVAFLLRHRLSSVIEKAFILRGCRFPFSSARTITQMHAQCQDTCGRRVDMRSLSCLLARLWSRSSMHTGGNRFQHIYIAALV